MRRETEMAEERRGTEDDDLKGDVKDGSGRR